MTCAKAILAAWLAISIHPEITDPDHCVDMANVTCTVLEVCMEDYDGDGCFKTAQMSQCAEPEEK